MSEHHAEQCHGWPSSIERKAYEGFPSVILPESPKALLLDSSLLAWGAWVLINGVPAMIALVTLATVILRLMIAWRQWRS